MFIVSWDMAHIDWCRIFSTGALKNKHSGTNMAPQEERGWESCFVCFYKNLIEFISITNPAIYHPKIWDPPQKKRGCLEIVPGRGTRTGGDGVGGFM